MNDPEGRPAFGADVAMVSRQFLNDGFFFCGMVTRESHRGRTATDGRFRFTGVGVGPVSLSARQDFYPTPATAAGTLTSGSQELSFTLQLRNTTAGVLSGTVFLPDGVTPAGRGVQVTATGTATPSVASAPGAHQWTEMTSGANPRTASRTAARNLVRYVGRAISAPGDPRLFPTAP